jgi:arylsulfatase A-like enzyme
MVCSWEDGHSCPFVNAPKTDRSVRPPRISVVLVVWTLLCSSLALADRPNFVLIIGDDISVQDIGAFGNRGVRTPNLDRLARESLRFTQAYVTIASCSASRSSIITSRYPHNLETAAELHGALPEGPVLFPALLRAAGYHTAHAGKAHFGTNEHGGVYGPVGPARAAFVIGGDGEPIAGKGGRSGAEKWVERLRLRPMDRPFFMWFGSHDAHRVWDGESFTGLHRPGDVEVPPYLADTPETRADLALYYDEITRLDFFVGDVLRELERQNVLEETIVVFMSDNGRPFPRSKTHLYDDGVRTPLFVRLPKAMRKVGDVDGLVSSIDLAPTLLELAGVERPSTFQGVSLMPMLRDPQAGVRDYVFAEQNWHNFPAHVRMVRSGDWVYLRNAWPELPTPGASDTFYNPSASALKTLRSSGGLTEAQSNVFQQPRPAEELYNVVADPHQLINRIDDHSVADERAHLRAAMDRWQRETGDSVPVNRTPANIDLETGRRLQGHLYGEPPGASTGALKINVPGPVRR